MFLSMTGFGSKSHEFTWGIVSFEITSVNHKYQDFSVRLPRELSSLETRIIALMRSLIGRCKVKLTAEIAWNSMNIYKQVRKITKRNNLETTTDITSFLMIPGVFDSNNNVAEQAAHEMPDIWDNMTKAVIEALMEMKKSEGAKLKVKIESDLGILEDLTKQIKLRWDIASSQAIEALRTRIENVMEHYKLEVDEPRIAQEVALISDKWDIAEELARLEAHTGKFRQVMNANDSSGKKLDFLVQEMNREINTIGSKAADSEIRWAVVEAKTCIERIREQLQNIE